MPRVHLAAPASLRGARSAALSIAALTAGLLLSGCPGPKETELEPLTGSPDGGAGQADAGPPPTFASSLDSLSLDYDTATREWTLGASYVDGAPVTLAKAKGTLGDAGTASLVSDDPSFAAGYEATLSCATALCSTGTLRLEKKSGALAGVATVDIQRITTRAVSGAFAGSDLSGIDARAQVGVAFHTSDPRSGTVTLLAVDGGRTFFGADVNFKSTAPRGADDYYDWRKVTFRGALGTDTIVSLAIATGEGATSRGASDDVGATVTLGSDGTTGPLYVSFLSRSQPSDVVGLTGVGLIW